MTATLTILDVGHGNAAVVQGPAGVIVIDAGPGGGGLLQYLLEEKITVIDCVVISHADDDHLRGLLAVMESDTVAIRQVRINANAIKATDVYDHVVFSLDHQDQQEDLAYVISCVDGDSLPEVGADLKVEVIGPIKSLAGHGPGWTDGSGVTATTNSCSVVVRVTSGGTPVALLPGDIDAMGFEYLAKRHADFTAPVLVFPHHGGNVRETSTVVQNAAFAVALMARVEPQIVVFSIARSRYQNPRPEIVEAVRAANPQVRIACTQLSRRCRAAMLGSPADGAYGHLLDLHAAGKLTNACCAGTLRISSTAVGPDDDAHAAFKVAQAPTAQCLAPLTG